MCVDTLLIYCQALFIYKIVLKRTIMCFAICKPQNKIVLKLNHQYNNTCACLSVHLCKNSFKTNCVYVHTCVQNSFKTNCVYVHTSVQNSFKTKCVYVRTCVQNSFKTKCVHVHTCVQNSFKTKHRVLSCII